VILAYFRSDRLQHTEIKSKPLQQIDATDHIASARSTAKLEALHNLHFMSTMAVAKCLTPFFSAKYVWIQTLSKYSNPSPKPFFYHSLATTFFLDDNLADSEDCESESLRLLME
jgi:hypothetical protein